MNDNQNIPSPNYEGEEMKMPENAAAAPEDTAADEPRLVSGPILLLLAAALIAILGGLYYWFSTLTPTTPMPAPAVERPSAEENNEPESTTAEAQVETMSATSPSDEIEAIEADIEATNLDSLDAEMTAIEAELDAAAEAQ